MTANPGRKAEQEVDRPNDTKDVIIPCPDISELEITGADLIIINNPLARTPRVILPGQQPQDIVKFSDGKLSISAAEPQTPSSAVFIKGDVVNQVIDTGSENTITNQQTIRIGPNTTTGTQRKGPIILEMPRPQEKQALPSLNIQVSGGKLEIGSLNLQRLQIESVSSPIAITNTQVETTSIKVIGADMQINGLEGAQIRAEVVGGNATISKGKIATAVINIERGDFSGSKFEAERLGIVASNGDIGLSSITVSEELFVKSNGGDVKITFSTSPKATVLVERGEFVDLENRFDNLETDVRESQKSDGRTVHIGGDVTNAVIITDAPAPGREVDIGGDAQDVLIVTDDNRTVIFRRRPKRRT